MAENLPEPEPAHMPVPTPQPAPAPAVPPAMTKDDIKKVVMDVIADNQITPVESDKTIAALNGALAIMDKPSEREADIHAQYQDKLKDKDTQLLKVLSAFISSVLLSTIVLLTTLGVSWDSIAGIGATLGIQFLVALVIVWLKDKAPVVVAALKKGTEVVRPLLSPAARQGLDTLTKIVGDAEATQKKFDEAIKT